MHHHVPPVRRDDPWGAFGQLSVVPLVIESVKDVHPEYLVAIVNKHALAPVYSFLTPEDQMDIIRRIHGERKTSVVMIDEMKGDLTHNEDIGYCSASC